MHQNTCIFVSIHVCMYTHECIHLFLCIHIVVVLFSPLLLSQNHLSLGMSGSERAWVAFFSPSRLITALRPYTSNPKIPRRRNPPERHGPCTPQLRLNRNNYRLVGQGLYIRVGLSPKDKWMWMVFLVLRAPTPPSLLRARSAAHPCCESTAVWTCSGAAATMIEPRDLYELPC